MVPITIWDAHNKSLEEVSLYLTAKVNKAKNNTDVEFTKATAPFKIIPTFIMQPLMHTMGYFAANLGIEFPGSNLKPEQVGHVMITNVGSLGLKVGFAPLCSPTFT